MALTGSFDLLLATGWRSPLVLFIALSIGAGLVWILGRYERHSRWD
ncbi:MAG: hypothetical protein HY329_01685 [Chloroflexi bacterium]|nr:hypothetical protein [Chloroflexota bacterium]